MKTVNKLFKASIIATLLFGTNAFAQNVLCPPVSVAQNGVHLLDSVEKLADTIGNIFGYAIFNNNLELSYSGYKWHLISYVFDAKTDFNRAFNTGFINLVNISGLDSKYAEEYSSFLTCQYYGPSVDPIIALAMKNEQNGQQIAFSPAKLGKPYLRNK